MKHYLFLDDERLPPASSPHPWEIVRSNAQAMQWCLNHFSAPDFISFDHDLGAGGEAIDFAHWLIDQDLDVPGFVPADFAYTVHSQNPIGEANLRGLLDNYLKFRSAPSSSVSSLTL